MLFLQLSNLYANEYTITEELRVVKRKRLEKKAKVAKHAHVIHLEKKWDFLDLPIALETLEVYLISEKNSMIGSTSNVAEGVVFSAVLLNR